ncbi:MAG: aldo/keto reductase [Bacillota bacterium]|nr:aldo/keto reductase [Bacillota bacterium]MDW7678768.1 aldo/keto reductase [Bacillota bacterium]
MKTISMARGGMEASAIALGCLRISPLSSREAATLIGTALEEGIRYFDHADIYGDGRSEEVFGKLLAKSPGMRDQMILQTKCGIRKGYYDLSRDSILQSVEGSLKRLKTDYLDVLLLHRPDALADPEEIAEAFSALHASGKVRYFGVSNYNTHQVKGLSRFLDQEIIVNQLQFGLAHTLMVDVGLNVNISNEAGIDRDQGILDHCRQHHITIQAWSPLHIGLLDEVFLEHQEYPVLNRTLNNMAAAKGVSPSAIAVSWIMRHPADIQPIVGTTRPNRLRQICQASRITLNRQEWYALYQAAGNHLP